MREKWGVIVTKKGQREREKEDRGESRQENLWKQRKIRRNKERDFLIMVVVVNKK